ncbi:hypothetical protein SPSE_1041 [Staphylococcus pseudintermedius ED99]|nr:hypothetical protein SPSE_1041 [Staphylococcus pseudintermedius ED99]
MIIFLVFPRVYRHFKMKDNVLSEKLKNCAEILLSFNE